MADVLMPCAIGVEDAFGPIVESSCLDGFDFTLLFEEALLTTVPIGIASDPTGENSEKVGYSLVAAYAIVYIGLSISYAVYQHKTYRLLTMFRGSLIAMIFDKTLRIDSSAVQDAEAITLMSADIDRIASSMPLIHELYGSFIETGIALYLLYRLLGLAIAAPIAWIIICLVAGIPLAKAAGDAQIPWLEAIEVRLAATAKALGATKAIKMTGLADIVSSRIAGLRLSEIRASRRYRILNIFVFISYFASSALAPVFGFLVYSLLAQKDGNGTLTDGVAFAALSVFELLQQPMMYAIDGVEHVKTIINSFRRIQEYLDAKETEDYRITPETSMSSSRASLYKQADEKDMMLSEKVKLDQHHFSVTVQGSSAGYSEEEMILKDLNFELPRGQTTVVMGPVGSGKSTLLKLLLGELPVVSGTVTTTFSKAAYCPQSPWTTWGSIQSNIVGMSAWDKEWYDSVVSACALAADFSEFPEGDQTCIGTRGARLSGGQQMRVSLARALYSRNSVLVLDDCLSGLDRTTERHVVDAVFGPQGLIKNLGGVTVILATNSSKILYGRWPPQAKYSNILEGHHLSFADYAVVLNSDGAISRHGVRDTVSSEDEIVQTSETENATAIGPAPKAEAELPEELLQELDLLDDPDQGVSRMTGDLKVYGYYAKIAGPWTMFIYLMACATFVFGVTFPSIWVQWWTNANAEHPNDRLGYYLGVFAGLGLLTVVGCTLADRAPTSFLTSTNAGLTINRFSQDLELIDNDLPQSIDSFIFQFMSAIVSAVFVFIGSGYVAAAIPACLALLTVLQFYYLRTSRQLRLLDIEAKAPLFSQFLETVNGIACIRAYGWTQNYLDRNYAALNASQKPFYLLYCIQRWLTLVLDLFNAGVAIMLVGIATNIRNGSTSFLGVALFNIVTFSSTLQTLVTAWTQVEMALGAINRIRSFVKTVEDENKPSETGDVPDEWPQQGAIVFSNVSASYETSSEPVLKDICFSVQPGEKIAICGRTGSGKSSLVSSMLRMLELDSGTITIDGVDVSTIPRQEIRRRLITLPQEPFFLHGTVRENIDPQEEATDERIEAVLRSVDMWEFIESRGGLEELLDDDKLSHGQRQLFCLARAILKRGKILIMDEATSSVDSETDAVMQRVLREEFAGRTIVAIAHKLQTILDFDRILLLDKGNIIETGNPQELLADEVSAFHALHESLGTADAL
ncbi:Canalicular multispecific organic anion transporter 2 [Purpureocillium lavendulum]|uniref:Canalicular multispecific organic anion transporter 2 n=1 Tax=Purpureocillium lavendulum TaxID=1247861 RepID=A0AB34G5L4_9HYPO|nr:Canalicular multispecific organic anion transporter 2 [Purpureocillium lavendulum]